MRVREKEYAFTVEVQAGSGQCSRRAGGGRCHSRLKTLSRNTKSAGRRFGALPITLHDLRALHGPGWRTELAVGPCAAAYARRLHEIDATQPGLLLAHADAEAVPLPLAVAVAVPVGVSDGEGDTVPLPQRLPVALPPVPEALRVREADLERLRWFAEGNHAAVIDTMPDYLRHAPEARFGHYLMMAAACGGRDWKAKGRQFSDYENATGTSQVVMYQAPAGGTGAKLWASLPLVADYEDRYVLTAAGWKFAHRKVHIVFQP